MNRFGKKIPFVKMTGAGNDFILVDNRDDKYAVNWKLFASQVCNRRYGVGADGLLLIGKSDKAAFKMNYYNADGSYGGMCGNGGRCSALYVMQSVNNREITFEALDYIYTSNMTATEGRLELHMRDPQDIRLNMSILILDEEVKVHYINTGSPHVVMFMSEASQKLRRDIADKGINEIGRSVSHHSTFTPYGTNVNFVDLMNHDIEMRTFERGVEEETLACGTGAVATAILTAIVKDCLSPLTINTRSNEKLTVSFQRTEDKFTNVILEGPAKTVFQGEIEYSGQ